MVFSKRGISHFWFTGDYGLFMGFYGMFTGCLRVPKRRISIVMERIWVLYGRIWVFPLLVITKIEKNCEVAILVHFFGTMVEH